MTWSGVVRACLVCASLGGARPATGKARLFFQEDVAVDVHLCDEHVGCGQEEMRRAFLALAEMAPVRHLRGERPERPGGGS